MMRVLLVTDTQRVQRIFESLEAKGVLQLRTAATLDEGESEIAASAPEFTFVQSRISGFSGEIVLRHLKKNLPKGAKVILLAGDADDAAQAKSHARSFLDLCVDDEELAAAIENTLAGRRPSPKKTASSQALPAGKPRAVKPKKDAPSPQADLEEPEREKEPTPPALPAQDAEKPFVDGHPGEEKQARVTRLAPPLFPFPEAESPPPAAPRADAAAQEAYRAGAQSFDEIMQRASAKGGPAPAGPLAGEDRVNIDRARSGPAESREEPEQAELSEREWLSESVPFDGFSRGEPLADAMRRAEKKKRPSWIVPLALLLISIPGAFYLVGKVTPTPRSTPVHQSGSGQSQIKAALPAAASKSPAAPAPAPMAAKVPEIAKVPMTAKVPETAKVPVPAPAKGQVSVTAKVLPGAVIAKALPSAMPASAPAAKPEMKQIAKPAGPPGAKPAAKPETGQVAPVAKPLPAPAAKPAAKAGLKALPPFVVGARPDPTYGKTHPGWQRYIGAKAEYILFKEAGLFRAIQVIALSGASIPDQLFKRELREFGGIDGYQIETTGSKGDFLVEKGVAKGGMALTIYKMKDGKIKGFVLYYR